MESQTPNPNERPPLPPQPPAAYPPRYEKPPGNPFEKSPFLAGILSVVPGLGNVYNGLYLRGLAFAFICFGLFITAVADDAPFLIPFIIFFWLFNIIDAYRQALMINYGGATEELDPARRPEWQSSGGLMLGVAVSLVGAYGLVDYFFPRFDLSELLEYWWVAFLIFGPWLIYQAVQDRKQPAEEEDDEDRGTSSADAADEAEAG